MSYIHTFLTQNLENLENVENKVFVAFPQTTKKKQKRENFTFHFLPEKLPSSLSDDGNYLSEASLDVFTENGNLSPLLSVSLSVSPEKTTHLRILESLELNFYSIVFQNCNAV